MTLRHLCEATTNNLLVTVTRGGVTVAEFTRSSYSSIVASLLDVTVVSVTFVSSTINGSSLLVTLQDEQTQETEPTEP